MLNTAEMLCVNDPDLFMGKRKWQEDEAKRICARCTQQPACLEQALDYQRISGEIQKGTVGGKTEVERRQMHEKEMANG